MYDVLSVSATSGALAVGVFRRRVLDSAVARPPLLDSDLPLRTASGWNLMKAHPEWALHERVLLDGLSLDASFGRHVRPGSNVFAAIVHEDRA